MARQELLRTVNFSQMRFATFPWTNEVLIIAVFFLPLCQGGMSYLAFSHSEVNCIVSNVTFISFL